MIKKKKKKLVKTMASFASSATTCGARKYAWTKKDSNKSFVQLFFGSILGLCLQIIVLLNTDPDHDSVRTSQKVSLPFSVIMILINATKILVIKKDKADPGNCLGKVKNIVVSLISVRHSPCCSRTCVLAWEPLG